MISVCINTKNRPEQLLSCLRAICLNKDSDFEIIVIDQGEKIINKSREVRDNPRIKYFIKSHLNASQAKNMAITKARGEIIAFTDDDCLVDKRWLTLIEESFDKNKKISGIFGQVLPYYSSQNRGKICPCTFVYGQERMIDRPVKHWTTIGFGNNMAFKKTVFTEIGGFRSWLGPGSLAKAAEDGELALRCLIKGNKLWYNPQVIVRHNRWLTKDGYRRQCLAYVCGEMACYGYFGLQGYKFARAVVFNNFQDSYRQTRKALKLIMSFNQNGLKELFQAFEEFFYRLRGLVVALWFSQVEKI